MTTFRHCLKKNAFPCAAPDDRAARRWTFEGSLVWLVMGLMMFCTAVSCGKFGEEPGVVARVNGRPIRLGQLQREYEASHQPLGTEAGIELGKLQEHYGNAMASLVVRELIAEELERLDLGVTPEELEKAEAEARADYREAGTFEQVLAEEYVDLDLWRERLRGRLASEKLKLKVLRPGIVIAPAEAEALYRERRAEFGSPERVRILRFTGSDRAIVEERLRAVTRDVRRELADPGKRDDSASEITARPDRLPEAWRKALRDLSPGQAGPVFGERSAWQGIVLLERIPARSPDPVQDYSQVERMLLERKLEEAQDAWIEEALRRAKVTASPRLVRRETRLDGETADVSTP